MPQYTVKAPNGRSVTLTGDGPPTESEIDDIFAKSFPVSARIPGVGEDVGRLMGGNSAPTVPSANLNRDEIATRLHAEGLAPDRVAALTDFLHSRMTGAPAIGDDVSRLMGGRPRVADDLHAIVERMLAAGESEDDIAGVIRHYGSIAAPSGWTPVDPTRDPRAAWTPVPETSTGNAPTLAQRVRAKHPGEYDDLSDRDLEAKVLAKYPEYSDLPRTPATAPGAPASGGVLRSIAGTIGDVAKGAVKGAGQTAANLGSLVSKVPVLGDALTTTGNAFGDLAATALYGHVAAPVTADQATAAANDVLKPTNTAQKIGKFGEQVAETVLPGKAITAAGKGLSLAARMALEGGANAGIAAAQGGNPIVGGVLGAAIPGAGAALRAVAPSRSAADAAAVALAKRAGVPVDAATATGNRAVAAVQHLADRTLGGSLIAGKAEAAQREALATLGEQLAAKGYGVPVAAEDAGAAAAAGVKQQIAGHAGLADDAYDALRTIEADPASAKVVPGPNGSTQLMPLPVNLAPVKAALKPLYDSLASERQINGLLTGDKGRAAVALKTLIDAPDHAPLSVVDSALSDLKAFARTNDPALRTAGQGKILMAVQELHEAVGAAAESAGPDAAAALREGRTATKAKYAAADVLDSLNAEPVKTFQALTAPGDAQINKLRAVAEQAPDAVPQIGRAKLDTLLDMAPDRAAAEWNKLGDATKRTLYQDPAYVSDLDSFFHLRKLSASTPNPSGTAHTLLAASQGGLLLTNPLTGVATQLGAAATSALLHSRAGVQLLTQGLRLPAKNRAAAAAWMAAIGRIGAVQGAQLATVPGQ